MDRIYFDNAATSFPKAPGVVKAMSYYLEKIGCNVNRGSYQDAVTAAGLVLDTRELLSRMFHFDTVASCANVVFTPSITYSLNYIIKGYLNPGDHCLVSSVEHNSVMRPLVQMKKKGVSFDRIPCDSDGNIDVKPIVPLIKPNTRLVLITHASNVCGTVLPIWEVGRICKEHHIPFAVDSAQTAGTIDIDFAACNLSALTFTGHKGLLGPQGIGGFLITDDFAAQITPLVAGGTGSISDLEEMPEYLPDKFESGTMNIPGIFGLNASLQYLNEVGLDSMHEKEMQLTQQFLDGVSALKNVRIVGRKDIKDRVAVVSLDFTEKDNGEITYLLEADYGIMTRCGMHCAPNAHKTLKTFPQGTVRFSFGHQNTQQEVDQSLAAVASLAK